MGKEIIMEMMNGDARILEMVFENSLINVPVNPLINIDVITADDPDPKFVNVEVIRAGVSKTNNRRYTNDIVRQIHDMIPGVHGFLGHPDPSKYGFEFRDPQCIFVGSVLDTMQDGTQRCIAKAYLFKTSNLREWIPKSIAAGKPMTVSINGTGDVMRNGDYINVVSMNELESIDWANPGTEGMQTSQAMSVVRELQNINNGGIDMDNVKDIIKNVTVTELKAYNPNTYEGIVGCVTVTELRQHNPSVVQQIEQAVKVTEMSLVLGGQEKKVPISDVQTTITAMEQKISELSGSIESAKIEEFKSKKIAELVPEGMRDKISQRVSGKDETSIEDSIKAEIAYIREMGGFNNSPIGRNLGDGNADSVKESVANLFGVKKSN